MMPQDPRKELALLVDSQFPIIYLDTWEERRATEILGLVAQDLNLPLFTWAVTQGLARAGGAPVYNTQQPAQVLSQIGGIDGEALFLLLDFHKYMDQDIIVRTLRDLTSKFRRARHAIFISAPVVNIPVELEKEVARYSLGLPGEIELSQEAEMTINDVCERSRVQVQFDRVQMPALGRALLGLTGAEARRILTESILETCRLDSDTLDLVRRNKSMLIKDHGILEFLEPDGGMNSVGGLAHLKAWLQKRRAAFSREAERFGLDPPKGILILGVQGCGKSLCAKAVARDWNLQLLKFDASTLFEKYIGESEKNLRKSLQVAEVVAPSVLWIDEMEKMFPASGLHSEADGGLSVRIFGTFLNWMQEKKAPVFVAATSNDISALPPELLRKGRFDEIFFVDLPGPEERKTIFAIHLSRHKQDPAKFDMAKLAVASDGFSGAEIEQAVASSLYSAFAQKSDLSTDILVKELAGTYPLSVTMREKVEELRQWAHDRAVMAS